MLDLAFHGGIFIWVFFIFVQKEVFDAPSNLGFTSPAYILCSPIDLSCPRSLPPQIPRFASIILRALNSNSIVEFELRLDRVMDAGEPLPLPDDDSSGNFQNSDEFLDEFLNDNSRTCTHTHTCNPPGPDLAHTHTCFHTHTKVFTFSDETARKTTKRPLGNREAVRKYREKKKAHSAYLEEEVKKLKALNQQLVKKLQGQSVLESEISKLRSLLFDIGGKIDYYPVQKECVDVNGCGVQCDLPGIQSNIIGSSSQMQMNGKGRVFGSWDDQDCQNAVMECRIQDSNGEIG